VGGGGGPRRAEREAAYGRYATVRPRREKRGKKAYQNNGTAEPFYTFNVTMGFCSVARLKAQAYLKDHIGPVLDHAVAVSELHGFIIQIQDASVLIHNLHRFHDLPHFPVIGPGVHLDASPYASRNS